jgi:hypothetical protein
MSRKKLTEQQQYSRARLNAMKHGFASRSPIIPDIEDEADWKRFHRDIKKSLAPEGFFEELLVRRLATALWEIDRLTAYQVAATLKNINESVFWMGISNAYLSAGEDGGLDQHEIDDRVQSTLLPGVNDLEVIMRYGGQLHRQWIQILNQLLAMQARRRGEKVPLHMVDFTGPPQNFGPRSLPSSGAKGSPPHPAVELAHAVDARVNAAERSLAERKRARSNEIPNYLTKPALERSERDA